MSTLVGTHSGTFHADDVLAFALVRHFVDAEARVLRTRDASALSECDIVVDVGGVFDPANRRFDHHQSSYTGALSSAGMVMEWLETEATVTPELAQHLRAQLVDYVDAVDTGRIAPDPEIPCFARLVETFGVGADSAQDKQQAFLAASDAAVRYLKGLEADHQQLCDAREVVRAAMDEAVAAGRRVVILDKYYRWKPVYFEYGGREHPTDYMMFPSDEGSWKILAIPPKPGVFDQKRSLPSSWAGLMGDELSQATGVPGSVFCHKNCFIAVFSTREGAEQALRSFDRWAPSAA